MIHKNITVIILFVVLSMLTACAPKTLNEAIKDLNYSKDEMTNVERWINEDEPSFYISKDYVGNIFMDLSCLKSNNEAFIGMQTYSVSRVIWDELFVKTDSEPLAKINIGKLQKRYRVERPNTSLFYKTLTKADIETLIKIVNSEKTILRLISTKVGDSVRTPDRVVTDLEKLYIHAILTKCGFM